MAPTISRSYFELRQGSRAVQARSDIEAILRDRRVPGGGGDNFALDDESSLAEAELVARSGMTRTANDLAILSLVLGNSGVLSVTLLGVRARRNEIGPQMALGATRGDIFAQVLGESVVISALAATGGVLIGVAVARIGDLTSEHPFHTSVFAGVGGAVLAAAVSMLIGVRPAMRAARVEPVRALRQA